MKKNQLLKRSSLLFFSIILLLTGCTKDLNNQTISVNGGQTKDGFPNQLFDWEGSNVMMPGLPAGPLNPSLPWTSQSGSYIDPNIISDYKKNDGWELVYNTFNPNYYTANAASGGLYFALYNRFRGLLRYYLYIPSGQFGGGANIEHGLSIYGATGYTTSMLNFDGSDIIDPAVNNPAFTKTNNVGVAQQGGWYAMQYEIAYDPNFVNASFPNLGIAWNSRTISISIVQLNGTQIGTTTGNITQQSSGFNWASTLFNAGAAAFEFYGITANGVTGNWANAASGGLAGNISGLFSGIFGGNSNNSQEVDLKINTTINLSGTINTPNALTPNTFVFPGESIAANNGSYPPLYTSPLGVFNLSARPTVNVHTTTSTVLINDGTGNLIPNTQYTNLYTVNSNIFNSLFTTNSNAINSTPTGATINNLRTQVVLLKAASTAYNYQVTGTQEIVGNYTAYTGTGVSTQYTLEHGSQPNPLSTIMAVRVAFDVVPNNGAPKSTLVKTFFANIVNN